MSKINKLSNTKKCKALLSFHSISYDSYNNNVHWILDTVERIDLWPTTLRFKINGAIGEGLEDLDLHLQDTSGKSYEQLKEKTWKSANVGEERNQLSSIKSNSMSVPVVAGNHIRKKMRKRIVEGEPIPCLIQPPKDTILYNGITPPWND